MAEPRDRLSAAFTELEESIMPHVRLPGVDAAHTTVRRRRLRRRVALAAAGVTVVVLAPAALLALLRAPGHTGPDIGTTPPSTATPTPSASDSPQPQGLRVLRDSNVRESTPLDNALLPIPSFGQPGCPAGETQYTDGAWQGPAIAGTTEHVSSSIGMVATGDVNGDGTVDVIATINCRYGLVQGMDSSQLVAFTRQGDGPYTQLGPVFQGRGEYDVTHAEIDADGTIRAVVAGPMEPVGSAVYEWRSFRWNGSAFAPAGSPVAIPDPDATNLTLTVTPETVSGPAADLTVTVHNAGTASSDYLELTVSATAPLSIRPEGFSADLVPIDVQQNGCGAPTGCYWSVRVEPVAAGQSASARFTVTFDTAVPDSVQVSVVGGTTHGRQENATDQNSVTVTVGS